MKDQFKGAGSGGVLVVDDEQNILRALARLLIDEDFPLYTANSGERGLELLRSSEHVGLIISDQRMPGMMGTEFLARARDLAPEALRIMLTGYADIQATIDAINKGGAYRYITKPWNDEELLQIIRDALQIFSLAQENKRLSATVQRQNVELSEWNSRLKSKVLQQTAQLRKKNKEQYRKNRNLKKTQQEIIVAFAGLIELYSKSLRNHSRNVAELSLRVAQEMGLLVEERQQIHMAALLHDIGKLGTPPSLVWKSIDEMTGDRQQEYLQHAVRGQSAIDAIEDLRPAGEMIRHHHERFDGRGFPDRCRGEEIPLGARIIAMADQADRTWQLSKERDVIPAIMASLEQGLGTCFDPELYAYFLSPVADLYRPSGLKQDLVERTLDPDDLREGMILAEDLYSGTGLLLLNKGTCLDGNRIDSIRRFQRLDPSKNRVIVLTEERL